MARRGKKAPKAATKQPKLVEDVADSDDEEIPEDEAFNSEDERLFGHFFDNNDDDESDESEEEISSDESDDDAGSDDENPKEEDDDGGQYMLDLLQNIDRKRGPDGGPAQLTSIPESEYTSSISKSKLTLDNLMENLQETQGFRDLQKTFQKQAATTTTTPLDKVKSDRTGRKLAYQDQVREIARWTKAVQGNRQAETLDFKPKERMELTSTSLVDKFEPQTDFEKELEQALEGAGQRDEESMLKAEEQALQDDLGANRVTMEDYKKRRGQLAQVRALMFYHEQKRHHMKKIKSKKYRRIRKKQRERLKETELEAAMEDDNDLAKAMQEKEEVARIQERMTLAHKNTSKWAKRILKRGKNVDMGTRRALSAQLKRGDDLRRKMMGDEDESGEDSDEDLVKAARDVLAETEEADSPSNSKTGLFKLSFMQKSIQKQRDAAKEEARRLLRELQENEHSDLQQKESDSEASQQDENPSRKRKKVAGAKEMSSVLKKGELVASSLEQGRSFSLATSGGIEIALSEAEDDEKETSSPHGESWTVSSDKGNSKQTAKQRRTSDATKYQDSRHQQNQNDVDQNEKSGGIEENPWMSGNQSQNVNKKSKAKKKRLNVDMEAAQNLLLTSSTAQGDSELKTDTEKTSTESFGKTKKLSAMSQEELVRRAFTSAPDKEIDENFQKEKQAMIDDEDPIKKKKEKLPTEVSGWGSWHGAGAPPPRKRKLPKKLRAPAPKAPPKKRKDDNKPNVIINQKRMKKMANNYMLGDVPHPYSSRAEYEQAMIGGVGKEWNVTSAYKSMTRPEIMTRSGQIIQPISKKEKVARPPAKF